MKMLIALSMILVPELALAGFGGMANVADGADRGTMNLGNVVLVLIGSGVGLIVSGVKAWDIWPCVAAGAVAGLIMQLIIA